MGIFTHCEKEKEREMKRLLTLICVLFITPAFSTSSNITWLNENNTTYATTTCTVGEDITLPTTPTKRGYTFTGWLTLIPIEYIESTGTQYIDTGFKPNQDTRVVAELEIVNVTGSGGWVFGSRNGYQDKAFGEFLSYNNNAWRSDYSDNQTYWNNSLASVINVKIIVDKNKQTTTITNKSSGAQLQRIVNNTSNFQSDYDMFLFGGYTTDHVVPLQGTLKIFSVKIYDNGTLVRDMIPVLDSNNVPCMYDKVSATFFYNAGTGDFVAGPGITQ